MPTESERALFRNYIQLQVESALESIRSANRVPTQIWLIPAAYRAVVAAAPDGITEPLYWSPMTPIGEVPYAGVAFRYQRITEETPACVELNDVGLWVDSVPSTFPHIPSQMLSWYESFALNIENSVRVIREGGLTPERIIVNKDSLGIIRYVKMKLNPRWLPSVFRVRDSAERDGVPFVDPTDYPQYEGMRRNEFITVTADNDAALERLRRELIGDGEFSWILSTELRARIEQGVSPTEAYPVVKAWWGHDLQENYLNHTVNSLHDGQAWLTEVREEDTLAVRICEAPGFDLVAARFYPLHGWVAESIFGWPLPNDDISYLLFMRETPSGEKRWYAGPPIADIDLITPRIEGGSILERLRQGQSDPYVDTAADPEVMLNGVLTTTPEITPLLRIGPRDIPSVSSDLVSPVGGNLGTLTTSHYPNGLEGFTGEDTQAARNMANQGLVEPAEEAQALNNSGEEAEAALAPIQSPRVPTPTVGWKDQE